MSSDDAPVISVAFSCMNLANRLAVSLLRSRLTTLFVTKALSSASRCPTFGIAWIRCRVLMAILVKLSMPVATAPPFPKYPSSRSENISMGTASLILPKVVLCGVRSSCSASFSASSNSSRPFAASSSKKGLPVASSVTPILASSSSFLLARLMATSL